MKFLQLVAPPDSNALYRQIADAATEGAASDPPQSAQVSLNDTDIPLTEDEHKKAIQTLRTGLAKIGRYTVKHGSGSKPGGPTAYVSVNTKAVRTRTTVKKATAPPAKTGKAKA